MPVIGPEQQRAQRGRQPSAANARAHADDVVAAIELRLDQYGPPVHLAEIGQSLLQRRESLLLPAAHVADHIEIGRASCRERVQTSSGWGSLKRNAERAREME